ncbi:hypothetical protein [Lactococcus lactis]
MCTKVIDLKPIGVYIGGSNFTNNIFIKKPLKIFNPEVISFCENIDDSEIINTNSLMCTEIFQNIYYLENIFDDEQWKKLIISLMNEIKTK